MKQYEELAKIYDGMSSRLGINYIQFIDMLCERYSCKLDTILDLGCGTASLLQTLSGRTEFLMGLEINDYMLRVARLKCKDAVNIKLVKKDFRHFSLNREFDLVLCCFDAINYIEHLSDLNSVFECVIKHLKKQGYFVFDVLNEKHFLKRSEEPKEFEVNGIRYAICSTYDRKLKVAEGVFSFESGNEIHRQIPIEYEDIIKVSSQTGMTVVDVFSSIDGKSITKNTDRFYFVLKK